MYGRWKEGQLIKEGYIEVAWKGRYDIRTAKWKMT